jgi:hypothetical protein
MVIGIDRSSGGFVGRASNRKKRNATALLRTDVPEASAIESGSGEVAVLSRALDGVIPGVAGSVVGDALVGDGNPLETVLTVDKTGAAPTVRRAA